MSNIDLILMFFALLLGTQLNRFVPLFLPQRWLAHPILQKLNRMLPLVIMLLLVLGSLSLPHSGGDYTMMIAQLCALTVVVLCYHYSKNVLLSIALGILSLNGVLFLL